MHWVPCAAADAPGGLRPRAAPRKPAALVRETPRSNPARLWRVTLAAHSPQLLASILALDGLLLSGRRAEVLKRHREFVTA